MIVGIKSEVTAVTLFVLVSVALSFGACPVGYVVVKGRVENPPAKVLVRVELIYLQGLVEDTAETTLENSDFTLKVPFYTQSRGPVVNGLFEKCNRKPKTAIVRLSHGDEEWDSRTLDLGKDFDSPFGNTYMLRSPLVLKRNNHQ